MKSPRINEKREQMAALAHERWSRWMRYLFAHSAKEPSGEVVIPARLVERWMRQMDTSYSDLSEEEKESDRKEADLILVALEDPNA